MKFFFTGPVCPAGTSMPFRQRHRFLIFLMRVSCTYIVLMILSLQVLLANKGRGQNLDQINVTVGLQNQNLQTLFKEIQLQTGLTFAFNTKDVDNAPAVSLPRATRSVKSTLDMALVGTVLKYEQVNQNVIISRGNMDVATMEAPYVVQAFSIRGKITNSQGDGIPGVSVFVKGTTRGTTSDAEGVYTISAEGNDVLVFSSIGFKSVEVAVESRGVIDVGMEDDVSSLQEVVVKAGYYDVKEREMTGNISRVTAEEIQKQPISNPLQALIGRMPGVFIQQNSGVPGGSFKVQIRGRNSLRSEGNAPLYIVDGVPFTSTPMGSYFSTNITEGSNPLSNINPNDIESIEILKDADATAIYGSRGANGVVLITTKKGSIGKTSIELNIYKGIGQVTRTMNLLNTSQYLEMRHEAFRNDNTSPEITHYDLTKWDTTRYTDWQKTLIGGTANITNAQASLSWGNNQTQFLIGTGYYKETTVFPGDFGEKKISSHLTISHNSINKKFNSIVSVSYIADNNSLLYSDLTNYALTLPPNAPKIYDTEGKLNWEDGTWNNPLAYMLQKYESKTDNLVSRANLGYELIKGLQVKSSFGFTKIAMDEITTTPVASINPANGFLNGQSAFTNNSIQTWIIEPQLEYTLPIATVGKLSILIGATYQQSITKNQIITANGYTSDELLESMRAASSITINSFNNIQYRYNAAFGRINYNLQDKYIINITGRRDGSSRFGPGKQFANFGAMGVAWIFSNENFIKDNIPLITFGKLRASYGTTGSDQIPDYGYLDLWNSATYPYGGIQGVYPNNLFNSNFAWEINKKFEVAMELGLVKERILLDISYYQNRSSNQLVGYPLPATTGFNSVQKNFSAEVENTGLELSMTTSNIKTENLLWTTNINVTLPKNKLVSFPDLENSNYSQYVIGKPLSIVQAFHYTGVDPETGLYTYQDLNENGSGTDVPADLQSIKSINQKYYGGIQNSVIYKGIQLSFLVQFVKQTGYNYLSSSNFSPGMMSNQPDIVLNRWQKPGDITSIQKFTQNTGSEAYYTYDISTGDGDNRITDASFIRLKNISISYEFSSKLKQKLHMKNLNIYFQAQNLLTITNYLGMDPENQSTSSIPPLRVLSIGTRLTF